ncbi:MAG: hypothetical protein QXE05_07965 [Nitrososphaeria archaeon]
MTKSLSSTKKAILKELFTEKRYSELTRAFNVSETALLKHLRALLLQGLIEKTSRGTYIITEEGKQMLHLEERTEEIKKGVRPKIYRARFSPLSDVRRLFKLFDEKTIIALIKGIPEEESKNIMNLDKIPSMLEKKDGLVYLNPYGLDLVLLKKPEIFLDSTLWQIAKMRTLTFLKEGSSDFYAYCRKRLEKYLPKDKKLDDIINAFDDAYFDKMLELFIGAKDEQTRYDLRNDFISFLTYQMEVLCILLSAYIDPRSVLDLIIELFFDYFFFNIS